MFSRQSIRAQTDRDKLTELVKWDRVVFGVKEASLPILAVDLGGTKIATGIVSDRCQVMAKAYYPTLADEGVEAVTNRIVSGINQLIGSKGIDLAQLRCVSVAAAGAIDSERGIVTLSPNLPGWRDIPLRDIIRDKLGTKTWLINDCNAAALAEHHLGVGKGVNNLVYLTLGTGIGGAIILNGRLYTGACGSAGEMGHMTIDTNGQRCKCGNIGCWETLASGSAVAREAIERVSRGERSSLLELVSGKLENITAKTVAVAARRGDALAQDVINKAGTYLGVGIMNLVNIFNPEMVIIGGGMAKMGELLLSPARQVVRERAFPISAEAVRIVTTQLGGDAGMLGAAIFALRQGLE